MKAKGTKIIPVINPDVAGIDIASEEHWVAVPEDRDPYPVKKFGAFTRDLHDLAKWLVRCKIKSVAMESTGVYWVKVFDILESYGLEVHLVNARHVKNVSGRKTDQKDCQWLLQLHACGLLKSSFQADSLTRKLRFYIRHRKSLIESSSQQVLRMQKSLELMNIKLHKVISDILGVSGMAIVNAILNGERNPETLVQLVDKRVKASPEEIIKSLEGEWKEEYLFMLRQAFETFIFYKKKIDECDQEIEKVLMEYKKLQSPLEVKHKIKKQKNGFKYDINAYVNLAFGAAVTRIPGIDGVTAVTLLSEVGTDMSKWKTEKHFKAWLNLAPNTKKTGGKEVSSKMMKKTNKAGQAFRMAAYTLSNSKSCLGDYLRRKKSLAHKGTATIATAGKLASIFYKLVKEKIEYEEEIIKKSMQLTAQKKVERLRKALFKAELQLLEN